jgi:hypothetical protein
MNTHFVRLVLTSIAAAALSVSLSAQQGRAITASPAQRRAMAEDSGPRPQAFSVVLVLGEMQASGGSETVPAAARKALTDVRDFLPYKAYRLLDAQWTLCCGQSMVTRLRGPEDQDYGLELNPRNNGSGKWSVHFSLWEPRGNETGELTAASGSGASASSLDAQRVALERQLAELRKTETENHPDVAQRRAQIDALERALADSHRAAEIAGQRLRISGGRRAVIDTSFTMDVGETVVVGTSRLKGDKALIALLTAVAPAKSAK